MKKIILVLFALFAMTCLSACGKHDMKNMFGFETKDLEIVLYSDPARIKAKELKLIGGDLDKDDEIVYRIIEVDEEDFDEDFSDCEILEIDWETEELSEDGKEIKRKRSGKPLKVLPLKEGTVVLQATVGKTAVNDTVTITVKKEKLDGAKISCQDERKVIYVGETLSLSARNYPDDITDGFDFESSDEKILKVTKDGKATGKKVGKAIVKAKSRYDESVVAAYELTVSYEPATGVEISYPEDLTPTGGKISVMKTSTFNVSAAVLSVQGLAENKVVFSSADPKIAKVDEKTGLITAVDGGTTVITATSSDKNASAEFTVEVFYGKAEDIKIKLDKNDWDPGDPDKDPFAGRLKKPIKISWTVEPKATADQSIEITAKEGDEEKISFDEKKKQIIPLALGEAAIVVRTKGGETEKTISFTIDYDTAKSISFESDKEYMTEGEEKSVSAKVIPAGALPGVTWTSEKPEIAQIDSSGKITAKKPGETKITAVTNALNEKGEKITKSFDLKVYARPEEIKVEIIGADGKIIEADGDVKVKKNEDVTIKVSILPENAEQKFDFSVEPKSNVDIDFEEQNTAIIFFNEKGKCTITVKVIGYESLTENIIFDVEDVEDTK